MVQQTSGKEPIFTINTSAVPIEDLTKTGAENVKVQYLVDERHGSNRFALRLYTVGKGGHTPLDQHEYEHQVYVLSGRGVLRAAGHNGPVFRELREGDAVFVPSNAVHQFINERGEPFVFLCVKGNPKLYIAKPEAQVQTVATEDSADNFC